MEASEHDLALSKFRSSDKGSVLPDEDLAPVASLYKVIISGVCYTIVTCCVFLQGRPSKCLSSYLNGSAGPVTGLVKSLHARKCK